MNVNEQQVSEFAYQIWESEGRPFGHSERHWEMASKLAAAHAEHANTDNHITTAVTPPRKTRAKTIVAAPKSLIDTAPPIELVPAAETVKPKATRATKTAKSTATKAETVEAAAIDATEVVATKKPSKPRKTKATEDA